MADSPFEDAGGVTRVPAESVRFTIGGMLVITALIAVLMAGLFAFPPVVAAAIAGLMSVSIPAALVGCCIYGGASYRAFAIGMLTPKAMQMVTGAFAGMGLGARSLEMRMIQQQVILQGRGGAYSNPFRGPGQDSNAFTYFTQMSEYWDRLGQAYLMEETLFWGASTIAGLATLFVYRRFERAAQAKERRIGLHAS